MVVGNPIELSKPLMRDTRIRALSFTGSTEVGCLLLEGAAEMSRRYHSNWVVMLLFWCSTISILRRPSRVMAAKFAMSVQDCLAANRVYVHRSGAFVDQFAARIAQLRIGHGLEPTADIGPMTKLSVADKCRSHIDNAVKKGVRVVSPQQGASLGPNFVPPTPLGDVTDDMLIAREETFGPVVAVLPVDSEDEVIARANANEMGLAGYVCTDNLRRAMRLSERIECGMIGINTASFTRPPIPFGAWKQSGLGREGSRHGLAEFMELKYDCFGHLAA
ncbi:acyl-CoA reductase-like NAD-dependent aldehyde dehydrogenase [Bradyrhizobium sp. USDA 4451]